MIRAATARVRLVALGCALAVLATTAGSETFATGLPLSLIGPEASSVHHRATTPSLERARRIEPAPAGGTGELRSDGRRNPASSVPSRILTDEAPAQLRVQHILGGTRMTVVPAADGRHVYVGVGARIEVLRVPPVGDPVRVFETPPLVPLLRESVFDLERVGERLVATIDGRLIVLDLADPLRPVVTARVAIRSGAKHLSVAGRFAAVLDGTNSGGVIVDLDAPGGPVVVGMFDVPGTEADLAFAQEGRYLYVIGDSADLQKNGVPWVLDLQNPAAPRIAGALSLTNAGAVAVDDEHGLLWIAAASPEPRSPRSRPNSQWLRAYDLATIREKPEMPEFVGDVGISGARVLHLRAVGGRALVGMWLLDMPVGRIGHPLVVGRSADGSGLAHLGRGTGPGQPRDLAVLGDGRLVAVHDLGVSVWGPTVSEDGGRGIRAPALLEEQGRYGEPGWWKQVATVRDRVYLGADYALQVVDVSGEVPRARGGLHELGERRHLMNGRGKGLAVDEGRVIVANRDAGIVHVIDVTNPDAPREFGRVLSGAPVRFTAEAIATRDGLAFLAPVSDPLLIIDVADPAAPIVADLLPADRLGLRSGHVIALGPRYAYIAGTYSPDAIGQRIGIVDVHRRAGPALVATLDVPGDRPQVEGLAVSGDVLVASVKATAGGRLMVADISDPLDPHWLPSADIGAEPLVLAYHPPWVYTIGWPNGLSVFDLSDPSLPREVARLPALAGANDVAVSDDGRIYVAAGDGGLVTVGLELGVRVGTGAHRAHLPWIGRSHVLFAR